MTTSLDQRLAELDSCRTEDEVLDRLSPFVESIANDTTEQVQFVYADIESKRRATDYLHRPPELIERVL